MDIHSDYDYEKCDKSFDNKRNYERHIESDHRHCVFMR